MPETQKRYEFFAEPGMCANFHDFPSIPSTSEMQLSCHKKNMTNPQKTTWVHLGCTHSPVIVHSTQKHLKCKKEEMNKNQVLVFDSVVFTLQYSMAMLVFGHHSFDAV